MFQVKQICFKYVGCVGASAWYNYIGQGPYCL